METSFEKEAKLLWQLAEPIGTQPKKRFAELNLATARSPESHDYTHLVLSPKNAPPDSELIRISLNWPMHFAQTLEAGTVPEWKSRYIDYGQGKKLIARLVSGPRKRLSFSTPRSLRSPDSQQRSAQTRQGPSGNLHSSRSWTLPSPALPVHQEDLPDHENAEPLVPPPARVQVGRTPSFMRNSSKIVFSTPEEPPRASDNIMGRIGQPPSTPKTPASSSARGFKLQNRKHKNDTITDRSPLLSETPRSSTYGAIKDDQIKTFYAWLDGEVTRAEQFFSSQESDANAKMRVLEKQLKHLEEHAQERQKSAHRHAHTASHVLDRLDLPTLPDTLQRHQQGDYQREHVGYAQAKSMLRTAMAEYYRDLQQLADFRNMNLTGVRKIAKKFDKTLDVSTMSQFMQDLKVQHPKLCGNHVEDLIQEAEDLYAKYLEDGNHKHAVERLNVGRNANTEPHAFTVLSTGLLLGAAVPLMARALYGALRRQYEDYQEIRILLQIWAGFSLIAIMFVGMAMNIMLWSYFRINYAFIFEFNRADSLDNLQMGLLPALYTFLASLFAWITFEPHISAARYMPCIFLGIFVVGLAAPFGIYWPARRWLIHALWRLMLSGLYSVEFRDFFLGDLMCSLNYSVSNIEFFFCIYDTSSWWSSPDAARCSSSHSRVNGFLGCLPACWRLLQCLRRFSDTLDWFPHLLNAGKYTSVIMYNMTLSLARIGPPNSVKFRTLFTTFAAINGIYTACWDVLMDFSLSPPRLRQILVYPKWYYYLVMVLDPVMRQSWILYAIFWDEKPQSAKISYIVALIELCRRLIWASVRVENEHSANIARCRAFKDLSLPYEDLQMAAEREERAEEEETEEEGRPPVSRGSSALEMPRIGTRLPALQRAYTYAASPRMAALSVAHVRDFERRRPSVTEDDDDDD